MNTERDRQGASDKAGNVPEDAGRIRREAQEKKSGSEQDGDGVEKELDTPVEENIRIVERYQ